MPSLERVKSVVKKISSVDDLNEHVYFFGGAMPYIYHQEESGRKHSDIDILVDESYMHDIRELIKKYGLYKPERDSLTFGLDRDYGIKVFIHGVYVEFEPVNFEKGVFTRASFSLEKGIAGCETIPFTNLTDLIVPFEFEGKTIFTESMEMIMCGKEQYLRDKDVQDIAFIRKHGFDESKYFRIKNALEQKKEVVESYDSIRERMGNHYE